MTVVTAGETLDVDTTWYDSATSMTVSGSVLYGGPGGPIYMPSSFTVTDTVVEGGGTIYVFSGGATVDTVVSSGGEEFVFSGGASIDTVVSTGGAEYVNSGGMAISATINSGGYEIVNSGGTAISTTLNSGGNQSVEPGGIASGTIVSSGGGEDVYLGGIASGTMVSSGGTEIVYAGGVASGAVVSSGGFEEVEPGGVASGTLVSSGGGVVLPLTSAFGPYSGDNENVIDGVTIQAGAIVSLDIYAGGSIFDFVVRSGGEEFIFSGGLAYDTVVSSGGYEFVDSLNGFGGLGGVASDTVVSNGGAEYVNSGGTAISTTINSGGVESVNSGGTAISTTLNSGGNQYVESGGIASGTVVNSAGFEEVLSGGVVSGTIASSGGEDAVDGGVASDTVVDTGGVEFVGLGGVASGTVVSSGGFEIVASGGTTSGAAVNGGYQTDYGSAISTTINSGGFQFFESGGTAISTTINSGGIQHVDSGGIGSSTVVSNGGQETVFSAGLASGTIINSGGEEIVLSGGTATDTTLNSGGTIDVTYLPYVSGGSATLEPATDVLTVSEGGQTYTQRLSGNYANYSFGLSNDGAGGTDIQLAQVASGGFANVAGPDLSAVDQSVWGPGSGTGFDYTLPQNLTTVQKNYTSDTTFLGIPVSASANFSAGITGGIAASGGSFSLNYPIDINAQYPTDVADGQTVTINTSNYTVDGASLDLLGPGLTANLDLFLNAGVSLVLQGIADLTVSIPNFNLQLGNLPVDLPNNVGSITLASPPPFNEDGTPVTVSDSLPSLTVTGTGSPFLSGDLDLTNLAAFILKKPPINGSFSALGVDLNYTLLKIGVEAGLSLGQSVTFTPTSINVDMSYDGQSEDQPLGSVFTFTAPSSGSGTMNISASYILDGTISTQTGVVGNLKIDVSALGLGGSIGTLSQSLGPLINLDIRGCPDRC